MGSSSALIHIIDCSAFYFIWIEQTFLHRLLFFQSCVNRSFKSVLLFRFMCVRYSDARLVVMLML